MKATRVRFVGLLLSWLLVVVLAAGAVVTIINTNRNVRANGATLNFVACVLTIHTEHLDATDVETCRALYLEGP